MTQKSKAGIAMMVKRYVLMNGLKGSLMFHMMKERNINHWVVNGMVISKNGIHIMEIKMFKKNLKKLFKEKYTI